MLDSGQWAFWRENFDREARFGRGIWRADRVGGAGTGYHGSLPDLSAKTYNFLNPPERGVDVGGSGYFPNSSVPRADDLSRRRQGADLVAEPRFHSADHHGKNGGILSPGYLV